MSRPLHVIVVGGGGGGLALANFLLAKGIDVEIHEQASRLGEVGAGVQIAPNHLRLLDRIGLGDGLRALGAEILPGPAYQRQDGTHIAPIVTQDTVGAYSLYGMHRADLIDLFARGLPEGTVRTGSRAVDVVQDATSATVRFEDGSTATGDVVVAADGIHSALRARLTAPAAPVFSGTIAYRGLLPAAALDGWPEHRSELWMGEHQHFLTFPVRGGELVNYVGFVPSDDRVKESWSATGDPDELRAAFTGWDPRIEGLLARVERCFWWGLYDREPLDVWTAGRVTLLGDAAHPMLPHLGQGVNQAVEDGATLAELLARFGRDGAPEALEHYQRIRRERTGTVQGGSRQFGRRFDEAGDDSALDARDASMRMQQAFRLWLFDYDAVAETERYLDRVPA